MTPKERRDAQWQLREWADNAEGASLDRWGGDTFRTTLTDRAKLLRAVAAELDRVPEDQ